MKRSTWRFKRSLFSNPHFLRHDLAFICSMFTILIVASCQLSRKGEIDPTQPLGTTVTGAGSASDEGAPLELRPPLAIPPKPLDFKSAEANVALVAGAGTTKQILFGVTVADCKANPAAMQVALTTTLLSDFGSETVQLDLRGVGNSETVRAQIETYRISFPLTAPFKIKLANEACQAAHLHAPDFIADPGLVEEARNWLGQVAPDCDKLSPTAKVKEGTPIGSNATGGWYCHLPEIEPSAALAELTGLQTTMIRRWSRQPYLLARRLAVGITLAQALQASDKEKRLDTFCRIVDTSLPIELPATLTAKRWQSAVCGQEREHRLSAARFGLAKTVAEIDFMRQLFDRTSRLGFLTVRIPANKVPSRELLVSLVPEADVANNVARETLRLWATGGLSAATPDDSPHSCWHPVFAEDSGLMRLARELTLTGESPHVACEESTLVPNEAYAPARYFAESITSETEFIIANGRAKTLRLPIGRYTYKLRVLPVDPEEWDDASQVKEGPTGQIVWSDRRPRAVINTW